MKTQKLMPALLFLALCGTAGAADAHGTVSALFDHPEQFTDVKDSSIPSDKGRDEILGRLRSYLADHVALLVPAGDRLDVRFTDIDLAGEYEPWRGAQWGEVRIVKSIYPPSFVFTWSVVDASGQVVKQGSEHIRDMNFQTRITVNPSDPLRFEKDILDDWAHNALASIRKG